MQTIDIHTHLLNPAVQFKKLYDRVSIAFFSKSLGFNPRALLRNPYETYVQGLVQAVETSLYIKKICLLPVDSRLDSDGREIHRDNTVCSHTKDVLALWKRFPHVFIPFLSVNPLRPEALDLIDEYSEQGCAGAKFLQNYWGIDLNNEKFIPYYEKLKSRSIPLLIHTGSEFTVPSFKKYEGINMVKLPLSVGVTVIAAHMGIGYINSNSPLLKTLSHNEKTFERNYFTLLEMLTTYPNLYADMAAILAPLRARTLRHLSQQYPIHHKLLFGTDYPVPFSVKLNALDLSWKKRTKIAAVTNPFDRYMSVILEYFTEESEIFINYEKVI